MSDSKKTKAELDHEVELPVTDKQTLVGRLERFRFDAALGAKLHFADAELYERTAGDGPLVVTRDGVPIELTARAPLMPLERGRYAVWCDVRPCATPGAKNAPTLDAIVAAGTRPAKPKETVPTKPAGSADPVNAAAPGATPATEPAKV